MAKKKKWIQKINMKKGALRKTAKKAGALKDGIAAKWLEKAAKAGGKLGKRARLAKVFRKFTKKKKKK